jgi:acyl-CoA thioesterase I
MMFSMMHNNKILLTGLITLLLFLLTGFEFVGNEDPKRVVIFGDSITAGYGLDPDQAFPAIIQEKVDKLGWDINIINAGLSGETSAGGLRRIDWILQRELDVFVLELGGNDGLRGIEPEVTKENLQNIMNKVWDRYSDARIILTGMEAPPNMGENYTSKFRQIYNDLAEFNDVIYMPFILEDVGGVPDLNQPDGIHPTEEGHEVIAENLWQILKPVIEEIVEG